MKQKEIDRIEYKMDSLNNQNTILRDKISRLKSQLKHESFLLKNSSGNQREQHNKNCWKLDEQINEYENQIWQNDNEYYFLDSQLPSKKLNASQSPIPQIKSSVLTGSNNSNSATKSKSNLTNKTSKWGHFFKSIFYTLLLGPFFIVITDEVTEMTFESLGDWSGLIGIFLMCKGIYHFFRALS